MQKLPRSKNGSPIPAYSQSTMRIRAPSSIRLPLQEVVVARPQLERVPGQRELDAPADRLGELVLRRDRHAARLGERPVRLARPGAGRTAPGSPGPSWMRRTESATRRDHLGPVDASSAIGVPSMKRVTR